MNQEESRCPRCSDYDKVKEELENNKRNSDKEVKDSLKNCESQRKKLQKQLLTAGAIAIIAGTILGKEFVDTVINYINGFNDVKNAASNLVSMADTPSPITVENDEPEEKPKEEEEKPVDTKMSASGTSIASLIPLTQSPVYDSMNNKSFFVDLMTPYRDSFINDIKLPYSDLTTLSNLSTSFANLGIDMPYEWNPIGESVFNTPITLPYETPVAVVPGPSTLSLLGVTLLGQRSRRR